MREQISNLSGGIGAYFRVFSLSKYLWVVGLILASTYVLAKWHNVMDSYELSLLFLVSITLGYGGLRWSKLQYLTYGVFILSILAVFLYAGDLAQADSVFWLNYLLASQSAIMWMSALFFIATIGYFLHLIIGVDFVGKTASTMTWLAVIMGLTGLFVRWHESYLLGTDIGHIPVSNLYEVFILFCIITALLYLYYEASFATRMLGGFVLFIISAAVAFILWYSFSRGGHHIEPLVPALRSYWMKIHVPANFIGYGCFSIAAMLAVASLGQSILMNRWSTSILLVHLPKPDLIEDMMYKSIALGFAFFTLATILGALWAAEAWGGYWSWDPKETWSLIVWLNYAAWLHMYMYKGWRGQIMAYWALIGLLITLFAFLGVNIFLSGLHSYGQL